MLQAEDRQQNESNFLQRAFDDTDTISYGHFSVSKKPGQNWDSAIVKVDGKIIQLTSFQTRFLTLLISQQGAPLILEDFAQNMPDSKPCQEFLKSANAKNGRPVALLNNLKVQICKMKKSMSDQGISEDILDSITPINICRARGENGKWIPGMAGSYQLLAPV